VTGPDNIPSTPTLGAAGGNSSGPVGSGGIPGAGAADERPALPPSRVLVRGVQGFIAISILAIVLGIYWKGRPHLAATQIRWEWALLLLPLIALDYILGGYRYSLFFDGKILPRISLWNCMRSNWGNIFMGAATPFQTGGGPAQLYLLWRSGARLSDGILISMVTFAATLTFFLVSAVGAILLLPHDALGAATGPYIRAGFATVGGIAALVLLVLIFPRVGLLLIKVALRLVPGHGPRVTAWRERHAAQAADGLTHFHDAMARILRFKGWSLPVVVAATLVLFFNKYLMGYAIARTLGQHVPFGTFLGLQIIQLFLIYFAPTPGASGVAELSSVWLMKSVMSESVLIVYSILWRFATTVLGAIIGGFVLLLDVRGGGRKPAGGPSTALP
jgi:glycosyltransferase 2 family protein